MVVSVTIEDPSGAGWAKVNPNPSDWSAAATLHYQSAQSVNDVVVARLDEAGAINIWTQDPADVTIDVAGYYSPLSATWSYAYDGDGLRRSRTAPSGEVTSFTWDTTAGVPALLTETTGADTTAWVYGPGGSPLIQHGPDGTVTFLHADQLGSVRVLTDEGGDVVGSQAFDPYGNPTERSGIATPFGYAGEYTDNETGLQYLRARFYDPTTGQFLSRDPVVALTREPYGYVGGNPLNATDPSGLFRIPGTDWCVDIADPNCDSNADGESLLDAPGAVADYVTSEPGTVATGGALLTCLAPFAGWVGCAIAGGSAAVVRITERSLDHGFMDSLGWNGADALLTWTTLGLGGAFSTLGAEVPAGLEYASRLIPAGYDLAMSFAEWCWDQVSE